jgi:hypothetical protein
MKKTIIICFILTSCSSLPFPKSNITNEQALSVRVGQSSKDIVEAFGSPFHWNSFEDGSYLHIYTNDWQDGPQVFCRNIAIAYDSEDKVSKHWFTKDGSDPQTRCNQYSEYSSQRAASWSAFASAYSDALNKSVNNDEEGKTCYGDYNCEASQVCAKKKSISGVLELEGICVNMRYYEED